MTAIPERLPEAGRARSLVDFYLTSMRTAVQEQFQYRAAHYLYTLGMIAEPVIYLVVWTTIAEQRGGEVGGIATGELAAYYIVWTLVRQMNVVFTPYGFEWLIREGTFSGFLLRPLNPIHYFLSWFAGGKVVWVGLYLPIAVVLTLLFEPTLDPTLLEIGVFAVAIWGAYLIRSFFLWALGMLSFWTTRVAAVFETFFVLELLLSGRLVPLPLMPDWVETVSLFLPFMWTFFFPIDALVGDLSAGQLAFGVGMQALWIVIGAGLVSVCWRYAVRRYSAVGN